jgi:hypothetical protein
MKAKRTGRLQHQVASTRRISVSAFFQPRAAIALLVCGTAACSILSVALLAFFRPEAPANTPQRTLTFAQRVAYQRAIEDVYWRHRIWPKKRPDRKPSLDAVMSQAQLEKKVADYLRNSQALGDYWRQPITAEQLQAEMDRMAQHTKQPKVLRELFSALENDPFIIAQCLARPVLAERLLTGLYSHDVRFDSELKHSWLAKAETQVPVTMAALSGSYTLPVIANPSGGCTDDTWTPTSTTNAPSGRDVHTAIWTGSEMIVWGGWNGSSDLNTGGRYNPSTDSWTATSLTNAPVGRTQHTAVWTGSQMIVWGGVNSGGYLNTGGRYNPGTDSWTATRSTGAPAGREFHTAVWTGSQMIVWGGFGGTGYLNTGGRYCAQSQAPMAQNAFSRKIHGAAGTFDIPLPLTGNVGIECRSGGATNDYQMIINFATSVTVGSASVTSGTGNVSSFSVSGSQVTVNLTGVTNVQRITVTLVNVNDGTHMGNVPVSMGVLVGDVNGNAVVNASDVSLTKSQVGQAVSGSNFREDVNANGVINSVDVAQVKANVGTALP